MKVEILSQLNKYYGYARKIAGQDGDDLLHECLPKLFNVVNIPTHIDSYVYTTLKNEFVNKNSAFNKKYKPEPTFYNDESTISKYDTIKLHTVLLQLETEGNRNEVRVFKECYFVSNKNEFAKKTGIPYRSIKNICNFVTNEIKKRYVFD